MSKERFRNLYDSLLQTDELFVMFAGMTGDCEKDKNNFFSNVVFPILLAPLTNE